MNLLSLRLAACPTQTILLVCEVCRQPIDGSDQTAVHVRLFGKVDYAVCCGCGQEVDARADRGYRLRYGRRWRQLHAAKTVVRKEELL